MALMIVSKNFIKHNHELYKKIIDKYGVADMLEETALSFTLKFNIPGTDPTAYYDQWFNNDGSMGELELMEPEEV